MTEFSLAPLELAGRLALALALAVFYGFAFEETYKREDRGFPGGIRTFPMLAIAGAMLFLIEPHYALAVVGGLFPLGLWLHACMRHVTSGPQAVTLMIPASNLIAYLVGPIALTQAPWVVVGVSVSAVLLLGARERLHRVIQVVPRDELLTAGEFLVLVGVVLPLVPNTAVTSLTPITPYHVWLAVVAVCTLSYGSYLLQRYVPTREGALLPAVLGGIYSSTATTIVLAKRLREVGPAGSDLAAGIVAATAMMYIRLAIVIAIFDVGLALTLAPAMGGLFVAGVAMALWQWRRSGEGRRDASLAGPTENPLQVSAAIVFAGLFIVISMATAWISTSFGQKGILVLAGIVGASDIDPFVLNIAQGGVAGMAKPALAAAVLIASSSNNVVKAAYAIGFGGFAAARRPAAMLLVLAVLGVVAAIATTATGQ